jgi:MFS family permease
MNDLGLYKEAQSHNHELRQEAERRRLLRAARSAGDEDKNGDGGNPLRHKAFARYWLGIAATALGDAFVFVALPFLVLELGGSAAALGTVVMLGSLPRFLAPVIGNLTDRLPLRLPLAVAALARAMLFALLAALALRGELSLALVYLAAPINGLLTVFAFSASSVLVPRLVPRALLARANSLLQGAIMGLPLVGFGVAGALVATLGAGVTVGAAAPLFLGLMLAVLGIRFPTAKPSRKQGFFADLVEGGRYLFSRGPLAFVLMLSLALNAALSLLSVTMPLTMTALSRGAAGYGLYQTLASVGMLAGIVAVGLVATRLTPPQQIALATTLMAAGFAVLAAGPFGALLAGGIVLGFGLGMLEVAGVTLLQLAVPDGMRGRVLGLVLGANAAGLSAGAYLAGRFATTVDVGLLYAVAAALLFALSACWTLLNARTPLALEPTPEPLDGAVRSPYRKVTG